MSKVDIEWVKQQFIATKTKKAVGIAVLELLEAWEPIEMSPQDLRAVLDIFSKVALGHSIVETPQTELWVQAQAGQLSVGDIVRVRHDAFDGSIGANQNGRPGIVAAIRSGDIIFNSTDGITPVLDGIHYRPAQLEKRIR
jgi:hypothetical protein